MLYQKSYIFNFKTNEKYYREILENIQTLKQICEDNKTRKDELLEELVRIAMGEAELKEHLDIILNGLENIENTNHYKTETIKEIHEIFDCLGA